MNSLILLNDPPYGTERCYNALRLALALVKSSPEAQVRASVGSNRPSVCWNPQVPCLERRPPS